MCSLRWDCFTLIKQYVWVRNKENFLSCSTVLNAVDCRETIVKRNANLFCSHICSCFVSLSNLNKGYIGIQTGDFHSNSCQKRPNFLSQWELLKVLTPYLLCLHVFKFQKFLSQWKAEFLITMTAIKSLDFILFCLHMCSWRLIVNKKNNG